MMDREAVSLPEGSSYAVNTRSKKNKKSDDGKAVNGNTKVVVPTKTTWPKDRVVVEIPTRSKIVQPTKQVSFEKSSSDESSSDEESEDEEEIEKKVETIANQPEPQPEIEKPTETKVDSTLPKKEKQASYRRKAKIDLILEQNPQWKKGWSALLPESLLATNAEWRKDIGDLLRPKNVKTNNTVQVFTITTNPNGKIPAGAVIVADPVETFFNATHLPGPYVVPSAYVAPESADLRTLWLPINKSREYKECLLDGGSQIASMSSKTARELGLGYTSDFRITMESADKGRTTTLGLAKNVPVDCEGIVYYLQFHILEDPAYDVLLGRPFEIVSQAKLNSSTGGYVTATIVDPGTNQTMTLPTYKRGERPKQLSKPEPMGFHQNSRI